MITKQFTRRATSGIAAISLAFGALAVGSVSASATDSVQRNASAAVDTTYLADKLGLPSDTVIETVTYDRFQWLLQQSGQFSFLIGSASDTGFAANAVKVDTAAKAAGASKVYWFDPNLTGQTGIKTLDVRNTGNINLHANSQAIFGNIWKNVLGQYLGNGIKSTPNAAKTSVTITADDTVVNDSVDPIWDFRSTASGQAAATTDDVFFTYDKAHTSGANADKIVSWVNLSTEANVDTALGTAFTAIGGSNIDALSQFEWWKDSANSKHAIGYGSALSAEERVARYGGDILASTDDDNGWVIKQITYPELLHLLDIQDRSDRNFVILFGGTWCHNTRAVLKQVNQNALENGVRTVYNFDLVLDGGTVNGTNGGANPIHVRAAANGGTPAAFNFRPSWAYGDVVRKYFKNLVTEYDPNSGSHVSYYPGGDLTAFPDVVRRLQVPFLINYQRGTAANPSSTSIKGQWIQRNVDASTGLATYREYMTEQWFTTPSAKLGLDFVIPTTAAGEAALTDAQKLSLASARANATFGAQAIADLNTFFDSVPGYIPTRTLTIPTAGSTAKVTLTLSDLQGRTPTGKVTLKWVGKTYTANVVNGVATFNTPVQTAGVKSYTISYVTDAQIAGFSETATATVGKSSVATAEGTVTRTPTATAAGTLRVTLTRGAGLPAVGGNVRITLTKDAVSKVVSAKVSGGVATVTLPKLVAGAWTVTGTYLGDSNFNESAITVASDTITVSAIRR